jgi:hypothetical protein
MSRVHVSREKTTTRLFFFPSSFSQRTLFYLIAQPRRILLRPRGRNFSTHLRRELSRESTQFPSANAAGLFKWERLALATWITREPYSPLYDVLSLSMPDPDSNPLHFSRFVRATSSLSPGSHYRVPVRGRFKSRVALAQIIPQFTFFNY